MADNTELNSGSGGDTIASDDIGGVKYPRSKIVIGADGTNDGDVSSANPLPIEGTVDLGATDNAVLDAIAASLAGTLTVGSHAVTNAGTFAVQAAQTGTWTVDLGATDNAVLYAIAASLAGTLTVGSHAVTNAGTFAVQAAQSGTWTVDLGATDNAVLDSILAALQGTLTVTGGGGGTEYTEDVATANPIVGTATMMERDDALSTLTPIEGDWAAMRCSSTGALWVAHDGAITCNAGTNLNTSLLALEAGGNLAAVATSLAIVDDWDESDRAKVNIVPGQAGITAAAGAVSANTPRVTLASDDPAVVALQILDNCISGSEAQVDVVGALPAGTNTIGDVGLTPRTSGGCSVFRSIDLDESEEEVKATAGQLYGYYFANLAATVRYIKFYNATAANVTVGTTTPFLTLPVPAGAAGHINLPMAVTFDTAITAAATTGVADNDTGAPAANDVVLNVFYK